MASAAEPLTPAGFRSTREAAVPFHKTAWPALPTAAAPACCIAELASALATRSLTR